MRIFFDTEFTDLCADAHLISIGCVSEDGQPFYVELTSFEQDQCSDFVIAHVSSQPFSWESPSERHHALDGARALRHAYRQSPRGMSC